MRDSFTRPNHRIMRTARDGQTYLAGIHATGQPIWVPDPGNAQLYTGGHVDQIARTLRMQSVDIEVQEV